MDMDANDKLEQQGYEPEIKGNIGQAAVVLPYRDSGFWGLWEQCQHLLAGKKQIETPMHYWTDEDLGIDDKKETE